jgi:hypothetical protein
MTMRGGWLLKSARQPGLPALLIARLPFFYGWVILGCVCCAGYARQYQ